MVTGTLDLQLGNIVGDPPYETGWYRDPVTGQYTYYDAVTGKWYVYSAGYLYPLEVPKESAPKTIAGKDNDILLLPGAGSYWG